MRLKNQISALLLMACFFTTQAQNNLEIASIRSPQAGFNYDSAAVADIEVSMQNIGPNPIFASDLLEFSVSIGTNDTTQFFTFIKSAGARLNPGDAGIYTLISKYQFDVVNNYSVCVSIEGTSQYPVNTSKKVGPCAAFIVGIEERSIRAEKIYYANNQINFELLAPQQLLEYKIIDLSGKTLISGVLKNQRRQSLSFSAPARGLYFLRLQSSDGLQTTRKFIVR